MKNLTLIDFFCGAGGFSEGFRQVGFRIVCGYDNWKPAIDTYNYNFGLNCTVKNVLDFKESIEEIEKLPDTDVILGSPPCVSFSSSNKSGKADKTLGLELTEAYLRVVAVKKHKPNSNLKAWFMENVENSRKHLKDNYSFIDLNLGEWAINNNINPETIAIDLLNNSDIINSADYGSIQARKRAIYGEIISLGRFILPEKTNRSAKVQSNLPQYKSLKNLKEEFPTPFETKSDKLIKDPLYDILLKQDEITDHFYDTGIYEFDWQNSKYLKTNHPYMGKMSFPENIENPSRTVTATKIANSRESLIYKTEIKRKGNGEYRTPTIREAAIIMGFPITYQFLGSENTKWRLVGNAVCSSVSRALAKTVIEVQFPNSEINIINNEIVKPEGVINLNTYKRKTFEKPPIRNKDSRFRRHPFKDGNMTIALSNFDIEKNDKNIDKWRVTVFYGTGEGFGIREYEEGYYNKIEESIKMNFKNGEKFINHINHYLSDKVAGKKILQEMYENNKSINGFIEPTKLIEKVSEQINRFCTSDEQYVQNDLKIFTKNIVPKKQLYALYALNLIITITNNK